MAPGLVWLTFLGIGVHRCRRREGNSGRVMWRTIPLWKRLEHCQWWVKIRLGLWRWTGYPLPLDGTGFIRRVCIGLRNRCSPSLAWRVLEFVGGREPGQRRGDYISNRCHNRPGPRRRLPPGVGFGPRADGLTRRTVRLLHGGRRRRRRQLSVVSRRCWWCRLRCFIQKRKHVTYVTVPLAASHTSEPSANSLKRPQRRPRCLERSSPFNLANAGTKVRLLTYGVSLCSNPGA